MKLCFVARDEEEFIRYLKQIESTLPGMGPLHSDVLQDRNARKVLKERRIYKKQKGESNFEWFSFCALNNLMRGLQVYVMLAKLNKEACKSFIRDNFSELETGPVCPQALQFLESIERCMQQDSSDENNSFDNGTCLFIHWGGGDPAWYEAKFQLFCDAHPETTKGLRAFALSSRRRELFNVTAAKISLPQTKAQAQELVDKFSFARLKDMMIEYLVNYFSDIPEGQTSMRSPFEIADKRIPGPFQFFLDSQAKRLETRCYFSDVEKRCLQALKNLLERVKRHEDPLQLPHDPEIAELFSSLIRGGGHV